MRPSFVLTLAFTMAVTTAVHASGVAPGDATAQQKKEAMAHFTTGKQAADSKEWEKARVELRASLDIVDSPNGRLVLARALRDSGAVGDAWTEYGRTIEVATRLADKDPRYAQTAEAAKNERAELDAKVGLVVVSIAGGALSMTLEPIGETRADVELDPAARLLLLWGRREPSAPIDVHVQGDARPMLDALMGC